MAYYISVLLLFSILIVFSNHIEFIYGQSSENSIPGRVFPGCALTNNKIYCFGGFAGTSDGDAIGYTKSFNDHIELDLSAIGNFSIIDKSKIQWTNKSNILNGDYLNATGHMGTATASDGSYFTFGGRPSASTTYPFAVYHSQSDQWNSVFFPNDTYFIRTQIINIGNDQIWIWGGSPTINDSTQFMLYIYDYKSNTWPTVQTYTGKVTRDHAATLVNNIIYITGGANVGLNSHVLNTFSTFQTYNTIDGTWGTINTNNSTPTNRAFHTAVATSDNKYLLIYGGCKPLGTGYETFDDVYYVYDIEKNILQNVNVTNPPGSSNTQRYGHFAAIHNTDYLLLVFGYSDRNSPPTENFNVLNIENVYQPIWSTFASNTDNSTQIIVSESKGVDIKTIVPAVVVPVVVVALAGAVALFFFIRNRKRKQKKQFILEREDPRKLFDTELEDNNNNNNADLFSEGTTVIKSNPSEDRNSIIIYQQGEKSEGYGQHNTIKPSEHGNEISTVHIKPSEFNS